MSLERVVLDAYGWSDIEARFDFLDARYGRFYTLSTESRYELLMRLLRLNVERVATETGRPIEAVMREARQHV